MAEFCQLLHCLHELSRNDPRPEALKSIGIMTSFTFFFVTLSVAMTASAATNSTWALKNRLRRNMDIGVQDLEDTEKKMMFFVDRSLVTREEAQKLCEETDENAELAIVTGSAMINKMRFGTDVPVGTYWVNGIEETPEKPEYEVTTSCTASKGKWNVEGINIKTQSTEKQCMALVKGTSAKHCYLQHRPCTEKLRVLCSISMEDC